MQDNFIHKVKISRFDKTRAKYALEWLRLHNYKYRIDFRCDFVDVFHIFYFKNNNLAVEVALVI